MSPTLFPNGFRISGIPVAASFAHPHSFRVVPDDQPRDEACIDATEALGGCNSGFAKYWDENTVVSELVYEIEEEKPTILKKSKDKKKDRTKDKNSSEKGGIVTHTKSDASEQFWPRRWAPVGYYRRSGANGFEDVGGSPLDDIKTFKTR
jgi:hypothetical protein